MTLYNYMDNYNYCMHESWKILTACYLQVLDSCIYDNVNS